MNASSTDPFPDVPPMLAALTEWRGDERRLEVREIAVDGFGPLTRTVLDLQRLEILVGANASGKSSLAAMIAWLARLRVESIPPEVDRTRPGRDPFRKGAPPRIAMEVTFDVDGLSVPLRYSLAVQGPLGQVRVAEESVAWGDTPVLLRRGSDVEIHLSARTLQPPPNDLLLRYLDHTGIPVLKAIADHIQGWRVFSGFDVGPQSALRRPHLTEPDAVLRPSGENLAAVLMNLVIREKDGAWVDLENVLRAAIPGFVSLRVDSYGAPGHVFAFWREEGVDGELTLAELSEGTLLLLCWATLCVAPGRSRLLVFDEPEAGLHPRSIALLPDLFRRASESAQVVVMTHSPHLLSKFDLPSIRVIRRDNGVASILRPDSSRALVKMVDQFGASEIARAFVTDELEQLP